jgi:3-oxoacyl-[acyl-carrier-protein] synthase II
MNRRVVITGIGAITPLSLKVPDLWRRILACESGIHELRQFDAREYKVRFGGDVYDWSVNGYIDTKEEKRLDRFTQFALVAGIDAVEDSGIDFSKYDPFRSGAIIGSGIGGLGEIVSQHDRLLARGHEKVSAFTVPKMMLNAASGQLSIHFHLRGPNYAVATACASATNAMGEAFKAIRYGEADVMLTGGTESAMQPLSVAGFSNMKALSTRNGDPTKASRPFDADRDGFVLSEGAGILLFEELEFAKARGARIYAEVLGYGASADAGHITQPDAEGTGAARAMSNALVDGKLNPADIDYINAHGTSTPLGDKAETIAVKRVFEDQAYKINVSSTKSQLGHSLGASGGIELVMCALALRDQIAPPTINLDTPDPDCDLNYTPNAPQERTIRRAMSNSFGFGGHNASIIIGQV